MYTRPATLVGMMEQSSTRTPTLECHLKCLDGYLSVVHRTDGPPHDEPGEQIQDRGEVEFAAAAAPNDELGPIADPPLIGRRRGKLRVEQIGRDRLVFGCWSRRAGTRAPPYR